MSKHTRLERDRPSYRALHRAILERDGWRCQRCGSMRGLQVHHILSRSLLGGEAEESLITLYGWCHNEERCKPFCSRIFAQCRLLGPPA